MYPLINYSVKKIYYKVYVEIYLYNNQLLIIYVFTNTTSELYLNVLKFILKFIKLLI